MKPVIAVASLLGLLLTAAGAIGAHIVSDEIAGVAGRWDGALLYGFVHVLAAVIAVAAPLGRIRLVAGWAFIAGVVLFSGVQMGGMLWGRGAGSPLDAVSMLIPIGGLSFMAGWIALGVAAVLTPKPPD